MGGSQSKAPGSRENVNLFLVGKAGSGKSSTGNTILGPENGTFHVSSGFASDTQDCETKEAMRFGRKIKVTDAPGFFDTVRSPEETRNTLVNALIKPSSGLHAVLYVIKLGMRYTQEEFSAYMQFKALFDPSVTDHTIVVFTGGDSFTGAKDIIEEHAPVDLQRVLNDCKGRYVVFDNTKPNDEKQVQLLLEQIDKLNDTNHGRLYSRTGYTKSGDTVKKEVEKSTMEEYKREAKGNKYMQEMEQKAIESKKVSDEEKKRQQQEEQDLKIRNEKRQQQEQDQKIRNEKWQQQKELFDIAMKVVGTVCEIFLSRRNPGPGLVVYEIGPTINYNWLPLPIYPFDRPSDRSFNRPFDGGPPFLHPFSP